MKKLILSTITEAPIRVKIVSETDDYFIAENEAGEQIKIKRFTALDRAFEIVDSPNPILQIAKTANGTFEIYECDDWQDETIEEK